MIYFNNIFANSDEFKEKFGTPEKRTNKLGLAILKSKIFREFAHKSIVDGCPFTIWTTAQLQNTFYVKLDSMSHGMTFRYYLSGWAMGSNVYSIDSYQGVCLDGDVKSIRYVKRIETQQGMEDKVYKMRAAKFLRKLSEECNIIEWFNEAILNYMCEEFQRTWEAHASSISANAKKYHLKVNDDFERIYSSRDYANGDFYSCMVNRDQHYFYENAVEAKAASLNNEDGEIVARCIVFTDVKDIETGEHLRLAERQYSADSNQLLMRILINKLIAAGEIDGYKKVGAGCGDATAFVSNDGDDWSGRHFSIKCNLDWDDTLSYQDSFKYYNMNERTAYNHCDDAGPRYEELDTTDEEFGRSAYDDWHDYSCRETTLVYYEGHEYDCDTDNLDEFRWVESCDEYHHRDEVVEIGCTYYLKEECYKFDECGEWVHQYDACYSEITGMYYCCSDCQESAEEAYKECNWYYSELTEEYYEYESELLEAEEDYKIENWYYSEVTEEYYETEEEKEEAEANVCCEIA